MLYMIKRVCKGSGKVEFRKAGLYESESLWNKNGKCWTSIGALKGMLCHDAGYPITHKKTAMSIIEVNVNFDLYLIEIDIVNETVNSQPFIEWVKENIK